MDRAELEMTNSSENAKKPFGYVVSRVNRRIVVHHTHLVESYLLDIL